MVAGGRDDSSKIRNVEMEWGKRTIGKDEKERMSRLWRKRGNPPPKDGRQNCRSTMQAGMCRQKREAAQESRCRSQCRGEEIKCRA